jgi:tetratricopeptide (TPR) repeat protein
MQTANIRQIKTPCTELTGNLAAENATMHQVRPRARNMLLALFGKIPTMLAIGRMSLAAGLAALTLICTTTPVAAEQAQADAPLEDSLLDFPIEYQQQNYHGQAVWDAYTKIAKDAAFYKYVYNILGKDEHSNICLSRDLVAAALFKNGTEHALRGEFAQAIALFDELDRRFALDDESYEWVATALNNKGVVLGRQGRLAEAITVYDDLAKRGSSLTAVAAALFNKGQILRQQGKLAEAIALYDEELTWKAWAWTWVRSGESEKKNRLLQAAATRRKQFSTYQFGVGEKAEINIPLYWKQIFRAYFSQAEMLEQQGKLDAALTLHEEFTGFEAEYAMFKADPALQEQFIKAQIKRIDGQEKTDISVITRTADLLVWGNNQFKDNPAVREMTFMAFLELAKTAAKQGRLAEEAGDADAQDYQSMEMALYEEIYARFGRDREPLIRARVDQMLRDLLVRAEQQPTDEGEVEEEEMESSSCRITKSMKSVVCRAGFGWYEREVEAACDDLTCARHIRALIDAREGNAEEAEETAAMTDEPYYLGRESEEAPARIAPEPISLSSLSHEEAIRTLKPVLISLFVNIASYDEIVRRFGEDNNPEVQKWVARSLFNEGMALHRQKDRVEEALAIYDEIMRRFAQNREIATAALANSAEATLVLGRSKEAIQRAETLRASADASKTDKAVMAFVIWLADPKTPLQSVQKAIDAAGDAKFHWSSTNVQPVIDALPAKRKNRAECFVTYLEELYSSDAPRQQHRKWMRACLKKG